MMTPQMTLGKIRSDQWKITGCEFLAVANQAFPAAACRGLERGVSPSAEEQLPKLTAGMN